MFKFAPFYQLFVTSLNGIKFKNQAFSKTVYATIYQQFITFFEIKLHLMKVIKTKFEKFTWSFSSYSKLPFNLWFKLVPIIYIDVFFLTASYDIGYSKVVTYVDGYKWGISKRWEDKICNTSYWKVNMISFISFNENKLIRSNRLWFQQRTHPWYKTRSPIFEKLNFVISFFENIKAYFNSELMWQFFNKGFKIINIISILIVDWLFNSVV